MKKSLGASTLAEPTPLWCVGTYDKDGKPNVMAAAWGGICCSKPPCVTVSIRASEIKPGNILDLQMAATKLILRRFRPRRAVIDCPHATPAKFVDILGFPDIDMVAEHKADHRHKPASGGSIIAKVMRDTKLARLAARLGADLGSGYPHDAKTRAWLESLVDRPDDAAASREVRWGWSTCKDIFGKMRVEQELGKERTDG